MELIWNDGGRATCGFVGSTGDCVTRSIAIATGRVYRDIYDVLGEKSMKTPRNGVAIEFPTEFLQELGWQYQDGGLIPFISDSLPKGIVICHIMKPNEKAHHFCTVVDHVVYDTWNPAEDDCYVLRSFWTPPAQDKTHTNNSGISTSGRPVTKSEEVSQREFEKVLRRLKALDNTASNSASTDGEKRNAIRMMQNLMLTHNLSREDLEENDPNSGLQFARMACPVNGRRACTWEVMLAFYVITHVFPSVQFYRSTKSNRSWFWFYGPVQDVENTITLFRELIVTIASAARLQYGGYARGSGASYCEGYVSALPKAFDDGETNDKSKTQDQLERQQRGELVQSKAISLHKVTRKWLAEECGIRLVSGSGRGRSSHDPSAESQGRQHGAKQQVTTHGRRKRITGS
ncbi:MAG: DUF2786 domain-containing protein [Planctomycetota bacterium]